MVPEEGKRPVIIHVERDESKHCKVEMNMPVSFLALVLILKTK